MHSVKTAVTSLRLWEPYWGHVVVRKTESDWRALLEDMTRVQKLVHLASRMVDADTEAMADRIFQDIRQAYKEAIQDQIYTWGCTQSAVVPDSGSELSALRDRADWAANSITHTYNYELALEIIAIGEATPTANRNTYAYRLFYTAGSWDGLYWNDKAVQVSQVETMTAINAGISDFYLRNDIDPVSVNIVPFVAECSICQDMIDGNPYDTVEEIYRKFIIPPHVGCPHRPSVTPSLGGLSSAECDLLWVGI